METIKVNTSQHIDIDYPVAGLGERIAARLIDLGIFLGLYFIFIILGIIGGLSGALNSSPYVFYALIILYGSVMFFTTWFAKFL